MWTVAAVLLGFVVVASLLGFHIGPHSHLAAGVVGTIAAIFLFAMGLDGYSGPLLWSVLGADVVLTTGVGTAAIRGLHSARDAELLLGHHVVGSEGIAVTDLAPDGIVRVNGENWSASAKNGDVAKGAKVQVIEAHGLRLDVWSDDRPTLVEEGRSPFVLNDDAPEIDAAVGQEPDQEDQPRSESA